MAMDRSGMIMGIESGLGGFKRIVPSFEGPGGGRRKKNPLVNHTFQD